MPQFRRGATLGCFEFEMDGLHLKSIEVSADVDTGDATTALTLGIPDGATIHGFSFVVVSDIADVNSTTGTLSFTGGNTQDMGTISAFTSGTALKKVDPDGVDLTVSGSAANAQLVLSGGADNTPSGGSVKLRVWYWEADTLSVS
jgi:hypothetical protein